MISQAERLIAFSGIFISDILNGSGVHFDMKNKQTSKIISTIINGIFELDFNLKIAVK